VGLKRISLEGGEEGWIGTPLNEVSGKEEDKL